MDLILLQPGDQTIFSSEPSSLIDASQWTSEAPSGYYIELVSLHQGMKQQVTTDVSNQARTSGRPIITEFTLTKYVDETSVKFYEYCLGAKPLGAGTDFSTIYIARNSGGKTANIIMIQLRDAIISEIQLQTHPNDMPTEQFKLNFTEIVWSYTQQYNDTTIAKGSKLAGWSLSKNMPIAKIA